MLRNFLKGKCHKFQVMLSPYIDGRVTPAEKKALESHLASCQKCRRELESLQDTVRLLHCVPMEAVPRTFTVIEAKPAAAPRVLVPMRWATAIAVLVLVLLFAGDLFHVYPDKKSPTSETPMLPASQTSESTPSSLPKLGASQEGTGDVLGATPTPGIPETQPLEATSPTLSPGIGPVAPGEEPPVSRDLVGDTTIAEKAEKSYRWPIHQIEFALIGVAVVMLATTIIVWRRGERVSVTDEGDK